MPSRRIRSDARRSILAQSEAALSEARAELEAIGEEQVLLFEAVVKTWKRKPRFISRVTVLKDKMILSVFPIGAHADKFRWVDRGTKGPYPIPKVVRPGKRLAFQTGYIPRTRPGAQVNPQGGAATGDTVFPSQVQHPGIKARGFTEAFTERLKPEFRQRSENALRRGVRRARR